MVDERAVEVLVPGRIVGSYRVIRRLGAGGMGCVYEVEHLHLGVRHALKCLTPQGGHDDEFRRRFVAEGRILAQLRHPGLVHVIDLDVDAATGTPYFVMDLVLGADGEPHTLAEAGASGVEEDQLRVWFRELCTALDYIHAQGIVHRDIKLENVLLDREGHVRLSDFGISRILNDELRDRMGSVRTIVTGYSGRSPLIMGTQGYMAPEVQRGEPAVPASDVYSLGVAFFRLLTNVWYDPALGTDDVHAGGGLMNVVEMLKFFEYDWSSILPRMLSFDPKLRPTNLAEMSSRLEAPARSWLCRGWIAAGVCGGIVLMIFALWSFFRTPESPEAASRMLEFDEAFGLTAP